MSPPSIFNTADLDAMLARIRALGPDSPRQWGKMDAAQMLAHCQVGLRIATGEQKLKRTLIGFLFGSMAKKSLMRKPQFQRNLPTDKSFIMKDLREFEQEQARLLELLEKFGRTGPQVLSTEPHPFFGKLTTEEWDALQWKHLDHHLRQFGA